MKQREEIMRFRYSAVFQSVDIRFFRERDEASIKVICEADIKLPLIKKSYQVSTTFLGEYNNWLFHSPVSEKQAETKIIEKNESNNQAMDPVGFFLLLEDNDWLDKQVDLLVGAKVLRFNVDISEEKIEIQRRDKEQKLVLLRSQGRIEKIEVPVPLIGNLSIKRV